MMFDWVNKSEKIAAGLMSGTSLDGVDVAIVSMKGFGLHTQVKLLHYFFQPYDALLRERLKQLCTVENSTVADVCTMNFYIAERFAEAVHEAVKQAGLAMQDIDFISSHGQTVWHHPDSDPHDPFLVRSTLQIGDLSVLAKRTGKPVVGDFRPADMAVGGQGAPLVPYGDLLLFRHPTKGRLLQNIGGIGNCTVLLPNAAAEHILAFDTGPGNMVIDQTVFILSDGAKGYDEGGEWAAQGIPDHTLVNELMMHPYFQQAPPKSTGRELFGKAYTANFLHRAKQRALSDADIIATATAFTARSIADSYHRFIFPRWHIDEVIVSGGGTSNRTLFAMLAELLPDQQVLPTSSLGIDDDAKEAVIFALLGNNFLHGESNSIPSATGAQCETVMGKLALP